MAVSPTKKTGHAPIAKLMLLCDNIVAIAKELEEAGEIVVMRGGEELTQYI